MIGFPCIGIFGPAGSGKTTLMMRFRVPRKNGNGYKKTYIIDGDGKLRGPRNALETEKIDTSHIVFDRIQFDDDDQPVEPKKQHGRLMMLLETAVKTKDEDGECAYGAIGITSTTFLKEVFMNEWRRQLNKPAGTLPEKTEWMQYEYLWTHFIMEVLRQMPCITMLDGHQEPEKGQMDQVLRMAIAIPGKTGTLLPARLTDLWISKAEQVMVGNVMKGKYIINTIATAQNTEINTGLKLPPSFEVTQPMIDSIVAQIVGQKQPA